MKRIEIRKDDDGQVDEVVVRKPDLVHFERMSDGFVWCGITIGQKTVHVQLTAPLPQVQYTAFVDQGRTRKRRKESK